MRFIPILFFSLPRAGFFVMFEVSVVWDYHPIFFCPFFPLCFSFIVFISFSAETVMPGVKLVKNIRVMGICTKDSSGFFLLGVEVCVHYYFLVSRTGFYIFVYSKEMEEGGGGGGGAEFGWSRGKGGEGVCSRIAGRGHYFYLFLFVYHTLN